MNILLKILLSVIGVLAVLLLVGWIGLQVKPRPFQPYPQKMGELEMIPIPSGLPAPVDRFYRAFYGDEMPLVKTAVISGRATLRPFGPVYLPGRFRFTHIAGQGYRHYIEATIFGVPILKVNERYVDGNSLFELPFGEPIENNPNVNQGANLGMWSESVWLPSIFLTDPRVRWEPVDDNTALLIVPFENTEETYVVRFDPQTAMIDYLEVMRYKGADSQEKTLWINQAMGWGTVNNLPMQTGGAAIWMDDGKPWAIFTAEDVVYNVDVDEYIYAKGE